MRTPPAIPVAAPPAVGALEHDAAPPEPRDRGAAPFVDGLDGAPSPPRRDVARVSLQPPVGGALGVRLGEVARDARVTPKSGAGDARWQGFADAARELVDTAREHPGAAVAVCAGAVALGVVAPGVMLALGAALVATAAAQVVTHEARAALDPARRAEHHTHAGRAAFHLLLAAPALRGLPRAR